MHGKCSKAIPSNILQPLGFECYMRASYVESNHAGDTITCRSRTGLIIYLNNAPVFWTSKKLGSIGTSFFGSEFIAMKNCYKFVCGLHYKLYMIGIPSCSRPTFIFGDNKSVLVNSSKTFSQLKKKLSFIAYRFVREGVAMDEWRLTYINTHDDVADLLMNPIAGGEK